MNVQSDSVYPMEAGGDNRTIDGCKTKFEYPIDEAPAFVGFDLKDSGSRREFSTGSVRDAATGKGRYDLVSPLALERLAQLYERGAQKYDARNWEKGQPLSAYLDCAMRHLQKHLAGYRDEDHMAAAAWNAFGLMHTEIMISRGLLPAELDDLPNYLKPPAVLTLAPVHPVGFEIQVQLPVGPADFYWTSVLVRGSIEQALVAVESLRRHQYPTRVLRILEQGKCVRMVWPGDAPVMEFAEFPPCVDA